ncbi:MAG: hypothetical protein DMD79_21790, partial [Candidatus Rokuibacteriota bacterium]
MIRCAKCGKSLPDESAFCLACGAPLLPPAHLAPENGGTAPGPGRLPEPAVAGAGSGVLAPPAVSRPAAGDKQAYALSFRPLVDERLRYRVARFVCERATAHTLTEVQEGLQRGDFLTFLALTAADAEATRQGIQDLGVAPPLVSLAPATTADFMRSAARPPRAAAVGRGMRRKDWAAVAIAVLMLFVFGLVMIRLFGGRG